MFESGSGSGDTKLCKLASWLSDQRREENPLKEKKRHQSESVSQLSQTIREGSASSLGGIVKLYEII